MRKNKIIFIVLSIFLMVGIMFLLKTPKTESSRNIEKELNDLSSNDYLLSYTKDIDNPSYVGQVNNISIIIYNNGKANIKYTLFNCDLKNEKFKEILPYLNQEIVLTKEQINSIKECIVNNNFTKIKQEKEEQMVVGENYTSFITISLGSDTYTRGGNCRYVSKDYIKLEDLIFNCINPDFIENISIIVEKIEMLGV